MSAYARRPFWMRHTANATSRAPSRSVEDCVSHLQSSNRILVLCGAGLSAPSGLPTFRGAGGLWRNHKPTDLGTPEAFEENPSLVWLFYAWRRHMALQAAPNAGHFALAELCKSKPNMLCLTQNVDGLHDKAGHPAAQLRRLHGDITNLKCFQDCGYTEKGVTIDPLCEALAPASEKFPPDQTLPLLDPSNPLPNIKGEDLPQCPGCQKALLRPDVVWFGEPLDEPMLMEIDQWIFQDTVDAMILVGTTAVVQPAANYVRQAQKAGAFLVVINPDDESIQGLRSKDFFLQGDASEILPRLASGVIEGATSV
ncbi:putative SIR2 family histone deacetylase [Thozetella sp. PMI_491]|nr:putative SIR2 family histone deacetylase [Thozetella sp. PMI_491]